MYSFSSCSFWVMWRGGWHSSEKRRRRCIRPRALSWGLHSSCLGRPMILFTMFIFRGFVRPKVALQTGGNVHESGFNPWPCEKEDNNRNKLNYVKLERNFYISEGVSCLCNNCHIINYYFYTFHSFWSIFKMVARRLRWTAKPTQDTQIISW